MNQHKNKIKSDNAPPAPTLTTRQARFSMNDIDAFVRLSRRCAEECGGIFDEDAARFTFAGTPRADPAIVLLLLGDGAVGFVLLRFPRQLFTAGRLAREETLFILPEHRSLDTELHLHAASLAIFDAWGADDRELLIPASPHATEISRRLAGAGHHPAAVATRFGTGLIKRPADQTLN